MSENSVQSRVRLVLARLGWRMWRNNRGAFKDPTGRWIRFGLGNDSKKLGDVLKSSDLVGWHRVTITPDMVGKVFARFVSIEIKEEGWKYSPNDDHEVAQKRWIDLVNDDGGYAAFISNETQLL